MPKKLSKRSRIHKERIKAGLCGACGKRKLAKGRKACRRCLKYYAKKAAQYARKANKFAKKAAKAAKHGR